MKTIYILRHAKSSWDDPDLDDFDRPLNPRGRSAAPFMGKVMKSRGYEPETIISSPAARAYETAKLVAESGRLDAEIIQDERIYEASQQTLRQIAVGIDDGFGSAMIVGHNPGIESIVHFLTGKLESMPTAALAVIDLDVNGWAEIVGRSGTLREVIRPKDEMKTLGKGT